MIHTPALTAKDIFQKVETESGKPQTDAQVRHSIQHLEQVVLQYLDECLDPEYYTYINPIRGHLTTNNMTRSILLGLTGEGMTAGSGYAITEVNRTFLNAFATQEAV